MISDVEGWGSVRRWLDRLNYNTSVKALQMFKPWVKWIEVNGSKFASYSPDELIAYQLNASGSNRFEILDSIIQPYIRQKRGRHSYKRRLYGNIRSFFMHNRAELPRDSTFRIRSTEPKVIGILDVSDFKKLVLSCNPMYQAIFTCMFQGGMDLEALNYWNLNGWDFTKKQLDNEVRPIRIDLPGRKKARDVRPFYTYLGRDGEDKLRNYVDNYRIESNGVMFLSKFKEPLKKNAVYLYWLRHMRMVGLIDPIDEGNTGHRTGKNPHELRDLFRTRWQKSGRAPEVGEFLMGHLVDPLGYNKAMQDTNYTRMEYRQAEKWLNVFSESPEHIHIDKVEQMKEDWTRQFEEFKREVERYMKLREGF